MYVGASIFFLLVFIVGLASLALVVWGIVDAANRPEYAWTAAGQNKTLWIALQAGGLLLTGVGGPLMSIIYLASIRPKVRASEVGGVNVEGAPRP